MKKVSLTLSEGLESGFEKVDKVNVKFCGFFYNIIKTIVWLFTKKYKFNVGKPEDEPNFYVCRHKNMKGVISVMKSSNFDMHPFILHVFSTYKSAFSHFYTYTFTKRFKLNKILSFPLSIICSFFMVLLFKSAKAIPTYRNSAKAIITLKECCNRLLNGESVIVFPDVDYTSTDDLVGEIYQGFLSVEKIYYKKTRKHVSFVPLTVDAKNRVVSEKVSVKFNGTLPFQDEKETVLLKLKQSI